MDNGQVPFMVVKHLALFYFGELSSKGVKFRFDFIVFQCLL